MRQINDAFYFNLNFLLANRGCNPFAPRFAMCNVNRGLPQPHKGGLINGEVCIVGESGGGVISGMKNNSQNRPIKDNLRLTSSSMAPLHDGNTGDINVKPFTLTLSTVEACLRVILYRKH